jgi:hypothetical protein
MIRAGRWMCLGVCLALALLGGACGKSKLDTSRLESQMKETLSDRTGIGIKSVDCPGDVEAKRGDNFSCTATTSRGERVVLNVTQNNSEGDVTWKVARGPIGR